MKLHRLVLLCCAAFVAVEAHAEIYKRVDEDGHVTYSSTPIKGGKKLHLDPLPTMAPPPTRAPRGESDFRVNPETQNRRDDARRKILEDELATEQKALDDARAKLQEAKDTPEVYKGADGKTYRNVAKYEENVAAAQQEVDSHEQNVRALQTELANLK